MKGEVYIGGGQLGSGGGRWVRAGHDGVPTDVVDEAKRVCSACGQGPYRVRKDGGITAHRLSNGSGFCPAGGLPKQYPGEARLGNLLLLDLCACGAPATGSLFSGQRTCDDCARGKDGTPDGEHW